jgi:very-short-patch-repair endonuclease
MSAVARYTREVVQSRGWQPGTDLENAAVMRLSMVFQHRQVRQQHRIGSYRVDFAWPDLMVALEIDGWHHRSPEGAAHDAQRDAWLRGQGWIVLRVDNRHGLDNMDLQLVRICRLIKVLMAAER